MRALSKIRRRAIVPILDLERLAQFAVSGCKSLKNPVGIDEDGSRKEARTVCAPWEAKCKHLD